MANKNLPDSQGRTNELLWTVRLGAVDKAINREEVYQISSMFRPSPGTYLVTGTKTLVPRKIVFCPDNAEPTPKRWTGRASTTQDGKGLVVGKVRFRCVTEVVKGNNRLGREVSAAIAGPTVVEAVAVSKRAAKRAKRKEAKAEAISAPADKPVVAKVAPKQIAKADVVVAVERPATLPLPLQLTPQTEIGFKALAQAFPGYKAVAGAVGATLFATLAHGAVEVFKKTTKVDAVYRSCPSWAEGLHLMMGPKPGETDQAWAKSSGPCGIPVLSTDIVEGAPKTWCQHTPLTCNCAVSQNKAQKILLFGFTSRADWTPSSKEVYEWVEQWGQVVTIVPNPDFVQFAQKITDRLRIVTVKGDPLSLVLPRREWFAADTDKVVVKGFFSPKYLTWTKQPIGSAFYAVTFGRGSEPPTGLASVLNAVLSSRGSESAFEGNIRTSIVDEAQMVAAGRPLTEGTFEAMERAAVRAVKESAPNVIAKADEAYDAALIAWQRVRAQRMWRYPKLLLGEIFTPQPAKAGSEVASSIRWHMTGILALTSGVAVVGWWYSRGRILGLGDLKTAWGNIKPEYRVGMIYSIFVAPIWEEAIKRVHWTMPTILGGFELVTAYLRGGWRGAVVQVPAFVQHHIWAKRSFAVGVAGHMGWNGGVWGVHWWNGNLGWATGVASLFHTNWASDLSNYVIGSLATAVCSAEILPVPDVVISPAIEAVAPIEVGEGCKFRPMIALLGPTIKGSRPICYYPCVHNEMRAIQVRLGGSVLWGLEVDHPVNVMWRQLHKRLRKELRVWYWDRMDVGPIVPTPFFDWLRDYPAGEKIALIEAKKDMELHGVQFGKFRRVKAFVKVELSPSTEVLLETKQPKPRLIQGRMYEVTATSGPTFHALGKRLALAWPCPLVGESSDEPIVYFSGATAEQLGHWYYLGVSEGLEPDPWDVSVWDASVGPGPHLSWRYDCLDLRVGKPTEAVLKERSLRKGATRHGVQYELKWEVCSGDGDTSCGNTATHGKIWIDIFTDPALQHLFLKAKVGISGDNAICMRKIASRREFEKAVENKFYAYGFKVTIETSLEGRYAGEACSGRFWAVGGTYVFGPKIGRILCKTFWKIDPPKRSKWKSHLRSVAMGLRYNCHHIPILRSVISNILRNTEDTPAHHYGRAEREYWKFNAAEPHEATLETFAQMNFLYGFSYETILAEEDWLSKQDLSGPIILESPVLQHILKVDIEGYG